MRTLRKLKDGAWYEIRTAVNNRKPLFQSRQAIRLFARVLDDAAARFDFEIHGLCLKDALLVFYIKPADGFQLPRIMLWLKQTFAVRFNLLNGWSGHIWGDRYWSRIVEGELPEGTKHLSLVAANADTAELLPAEGGVMPLSGRTQAGVRPLTLETRTRVRPFKGEPAKIPRKSVSPPPNRG
ncbi:MAG: transposase [Spirochaetaceae bacterium]|jgi:REP element-mobilizing transposase RayT|nr:transposase [Spirochaetaceae bacterium]